VANFLLDGSYVRRDQPEPAVGTVEELPPFDGG
jgi:hypothetical protein